MPSYYVMMRRLCTPAELGLVDRASLSGSPVALVVAVTLLLYYSYGTIYRYSSPSSWLSRQVISVMMMT